MLEELLDNAFVDHRTLRFTPKLLILAFLYLSVGLYLGIFYLGDLVEEFARHTLYLTQDDQGYNSFFNEFLSTFSLNCLDLIEAVKFASTFFAVVIDLTDGE